MKRLAIVSSHPIQYNAPLFQLITLRNKIKIKVYYTWSQSERGMIYDPGFGINTKWDIPLLENYDYCFVENVSKRPGLDHYNGIQNPELIYKILDFSPDAVLVYGWNFSSHLKLMRYCKNKIPIFFRGDSTLLDENYNFLRKFLRTIFLKWVYKNIDYALYAGKANKKYYLKFGITEQKLIFVPHVVDNARFFKNENNIDAAKIIRQQFKIPPDATVLLFAGKMESKKNPLLLLRAVTEMDNENLHILFVGAGSLQKELKENSRGNKNIHFMEFQNQKMMPTIYQTADIFVLPSGGPEETWGLAINEAMASSLPVIVSDKCGCKDDLVENGKNGFIFQSGNQNDLQQKIVSVMEKQKTMSKQSLNKIQVFSLENAAGALEQAVINAHFK